MCRFLLIAILLTADAAFAAPPPGGPGAYSGWFRGLTAPDTGLGCCDTADCRFALWRYRDGGYEVWLDERWHPVPDEKVLDESVANPTGQAVVCWSPHLGILCFVPEDPA